MVGAQGRQLGAAVRGHPAEHLGAGEVASGPPHLPDALIGFVPMGQRRIDLALEHGPPPVVETLTGSGVEIHGVQEHAPHVVLALIPGAVADPDRTSAVIARQVIQGLLGELPLPADAVHDLQVGVPLGHVRDEVEEVVGLAVKAQRVEAPQHERRVAQPAVAVVVVALPAGRLG